MTVKKQKQKVNYYMTIYVVFEFRSIRHLQEGSQTDGKGT